MTALIAFVLVVAVCGFVVLPLLRRDTVQDLVGDSRHGELWNREKAVAVLAIVEADFDRATGKLSDEDYRVLRSDYEGRALQAMDELRRGEDTPPEAAAGPEAVAGGGAVRFCGVCGARFGEADRFCSGCGGPRRPV
jgi:hypothetical protein